MRDTRFIPCDACEGSGNEYVHRPQPDDPEYFYIRYGHPCPVCDGEGSIEIEQEMPEEIDMEDHL